MKLDICTRAPRRNGFLNVDAVVGPNVDFVTDIRSRLSFDNEQIEEIVSCATLEHLLLTQTQRLLKEFYRILKPSGKLTIAVPDLNKICNGYLNKTIDFNLTNQYLYGQITENSLLEYDSHKSAYDFQQLKFLLETAGFHDIKEEKYTFPMHIKELMIQITCIK
jgi:predicted SAM-dependent methyltransferase